MSIQAMQAMAEIPGEAERLLGEIIDLSERATEKTIPGIQVRLMRIRGLLEEGASYGLFPGHQPIVQEHVVLLGGLVSGDFKPVNLWIHVKAVLTEHNFRLIRKW